MLNILAVVLAAGSFEWLAVPFAIYTPETSLGAGGLGIAFHRPEDRPDAVRSDSYSALALYTINHQFTSRADVTLQLLDGEYRLTLTGGYRRFPDLFYGVGNEADGEEGYTPQAPISRGYFTRRVTDNLYAGAAFDTEFLEMVEVENDGRLAGDGVTGARGGDAVGVGAIVSWDDRDSAHWPRRGGLHELSTVSFFPKVGSDFAFTRYRLETRSFLGLGGVHVIGLHLFAEAEGGDPPFYQMSELGGMERLRGVYKGRYRDRCSFNGQFEYRYPIYWRFRGTAFVAAGRVAHQVWELTPDGLHPGGGLGLRFLLSKKEELHVRADLAYAGEGLQPYITFGEAF